MRGATSTSTARTPWTVFQSTHPLRGATFSLATIRHLRRNFNPRTPCGVRLGSILMPEVIQVFQSTHPLRGATPICAEILTIIKFQSTHPLRGATLRPAPRGSNGLISIHAPLAGCDGHNGMNDWLDKISIHAPLAGCDPCTTRREITRRYFNPRTPCGVRHSTMAHMREKWRISIHAPLAGCDMPNGNGWFLDIISIHAPLAGCDSPSSCRYTCP